jgi:hypothetical protein
MKTAKGKRQKAKGKRKSLRRLNGGTNKFNNYNKKSQNYQNRIGIPPTKLTDLYKQNEFIRSLLKYLLIRDRKDITDVVQMIQNKKNAGANNVIKSQELDRRLQYEINDDDIDHLIKNLNNRSYNMYVKEYPNPGGIGTFKIDDFRLESIKLTDLFD